MDTSTFAGLREYYHVNSLILARAYHQFDDHLQEQAEGILAGYVADEILSQSDAIALHEVEMQFATMLRYAMLPRFLGLLERTVKGLCKVAEPDKYGSVGQRDWVREHKQFLNGLKIDLTPVQRELDDLNHLIALRDCVIHANGEIALCKYPTRVEEAMRKIDTARPLKEGFLFLGDQVIPIAKSTMSGILLCLFDAFGHRLDTRRYF